MSQVRDDDRLKPAKVYRYRRYGPDRRDGGGTRVGPGSGASGRDDIWSGQDLVRCRGLGLLRGVLPLPGMVVRPALVATQAAQAEIPRSLPTTRLRRVCRGGVDLHTTRDTGADRRGVQPLCQGG